MSKHLGAWNTAATLPHISPWPFYWPLCVRRWRDPITRTLVTEDRTDAAVVHLVGRDHPLLMIAVPAFYDHVRARRLPRPAVHHNIVFLWETRLEILEVSLHNLILSHFYKRCQ
jgi:hypothetical protein